ncbi:MAG: RidA family protein [Mesorhizobium sp.]|uniref:RidA family protein n=1 Tax=Mesorhizobium sp. TaxID=1871066 RepID=UPI000FE875C6|nr:RidA family protein [Mesorhizobium sp.]RWE81301.1 MAG: RidA family protein [Mesorhizobium sp.]TJW61576.1 MAG: RidA family protein [Mesorhizobium sp.]
MFEVVKTGITSSVSPVSGMVRKGPLVLTAQIPKDPATGKIVEGDIIIQTRQMLENVKTGLAAAGGSLADVMRAEVFLVDAADAPAMNAVWREFFSEPWPCRATVVVKEFLSPGMRIEMTATAWIDEA